MSVQFEVSITSISGVIDTHLAEKEKNMAAKCAIKIT